MYKKIVLAMLLLLIAATTVGCNEEKADENTSMTVTEAESVAGNESLETVTSEDAVSEEATKEEFTFEDLSKRCFYFSSGAGGWGEEFTIEKDGYFTGAYHDSEMGVIGEGYENGTRYSSTYTGHFTDLKRVDEYSYTMKLADITYKEELDTEEIIDGVRYIYTASYCFGGNDTYTVYLPGTPLDRLSEEVMIWLNDWKYLNPDATELNVIVIVDEKNQYGMNSYERPGALEDAQATYGIYKESYDYYGEQLQEAYTTLEMVDAVSMQYEVSDSCLNYIWNLVRYNVEDDEFEQILQEQRRWIENRDAQAQAAMDEWQGGSFAPVAYYDMAANLTIKRCEELIEYLK